MSFEIQYITMAFSLLIQSFLSYFLFGYSMAIVIPVSVISFVFYLFIGKLFTLSLIIYYLLVFANIIFSKHKSILNCNSYSKITNILLMTLYLLCCFHYLLFGDTINILFLIIYSYYNYRFVLFIYTNHISRTYLVVVIVT